MLLRKGLMNMLGVTQLLATMPVLHTRTSISACERQRCAEPKPPGAAVRFPGAGARPEAIEQLAALQTKPEIDTVP